MRALLFTIIVANIVQNCLSVQPGDPFPMHRHDSKFHTLNLSSNSIGPEDPDDDIPVPSKPLTNAFESNEQSNGFMENSVVPLKKSFARIESEDTQQDENELKLQPLWTTTPLPLSSEPSISRNNLIKINRWKFHDILSHETRYWYEPEGGNMGKGWNLETVAFLAYSKREPGTKPVFSFHSEVAGEWTNTLQLDSTPPMIGTEHWISDGISFYTYPISRHVNGLQPVWRYWNILKSNATNKLLTFIVINKTEYEQERPGWVRDQILFYALPYEA